MRLSAYWRHRALASSRRTGDSGSTGAACRRRGRWGGRWGGSLWTAIGAGRTIRSWSCAPWRYGWSSEPDPDTDPEDAERLGRQLRDELRDLDVDDVEPVEGGPPPDGAKSGGVDLADRVAGHPRPAAGCSAPVIGTITAWLTRGAGDHKVTVTIDGDTLELGRATDAERAEIVDAFVRRHRPV